MSPVNVSTIGAYIREQREQARISLRQLAQAAGVSNPYLSQIERGLRRPSADILQQIAKGLRISAEALYVQAGLLEDRPPGSAVRDAVLTDPELTERQKQMLIEIYESFRKETASAVLVGEAADDDEGTELAIDQAALAWPEALEPAALARWASATDQDQLADPVLAASATLDLAEGQQEPGSRRAGAPESAAPDQVPAPGRDAEPEAVPGPVASAADADTADTARTPAGTADPAAANTGEANTGDANTGDADSEDAGGADATIHQFPSAPSAR